MLAGRQRPGRRAPSRAPLPGPSSAAQHSSPALQPAAPPGLQARQCMEQQLSLLTQWLFAFNGHHNIHVIQPHPAYWCSCPAPNIHAPPRPRPPRPRVFVPVAGSGRKGVTGRRLGQYLPSAASVYPTLMRLWCIYCWPGRPSAPHQSQQFNLGHLAGWI